MRILGAGICAGLAWLVLAGSARAQEAREKPGYPLLEVERPLTLPRGITEIPAGLSYFDADRFFNADGESTAFADSDDWRLLTVLIEMDYGLASWLEVGAGIPYYSGRQFSGEGDNLGDLFGFARFKLLENKAKTRELALDFKTSFPTGDSDIVMQLENKRFFQKNLRTGDPSMDFFFGLSGRWTYNKMAFRGGFAYGYRLEGEIKSGIEAVEDTVKFDPGESFDAHFDYLYQIRSWLVGTIGLDYSEQAANKIAGQSQDDDWRLLRVRPGAELQITPNMDLAVEIALPLSGQNQPVAYPIIVTWKNRF